MRVVTVLALMALLSCVSSVDKRIQYTLTLASVDIDGRAVGTIEGNRFSDDTVAVPWSPSPNALHLAIDNLTDVTLRVMWDDASIIDHRGENHRVLHRGVRYAEKGQFQPPSVISQKSRLIDAIVPSDAVEWTEDGWRSRGLFPSLERVTPYTMEPTMDQLRDGHVSVLLPLDRDGACMEYLFRFRIDNPQTMDLPR